jgi:PmbA protein
MLAELEKRAIEAVELTRKSGADHAWATATQGRDVEFEYRDGALEKVQDTTSRNLAVQVYAEGRYSSHRTTDLNPERLQSFLDEAVAITRALEPDPSRKITPAIYYQDRPSGDLDVVDANVQAIDRDQRMVWCQQLDEVATDHERVISATGGVYDGSQMSASASSNGFVGSMESTYCWYGSSITLRDQGERRASDGYFVGATHVGGLPAADEVARVALERALSRLDAEKGPTVKTTMVVDSRAAASLIGRLLGPANARSIQQGRSFWTSLLGEKAFSDVLTITDDPLRKQGMGSRHYDAEGISARTIRLIENGVVENIYVDTYYGGKAKMSPTTGTASNRIVKPGPQSLEQLLGEVGNGVYVNSWLGGNADGTTGDFSLGLRGNMIENGQLGRPVAEMNVTGNLRDLFGQLVLVGNDPYPYSTTLSPSLVFADVDFSGA